MTLVGADHNSFTDILALAEQLGVPGDTPLSGDRAVELTRTIVATFFDQRLRGIAHPLLDGPDPAFPELRFHNPWPNSVDADRQSLRFDDSHDPLQIA
ncbi:hypothetical protein [Nocardia pseudobrasiliensis]|uniref:Uncharacterized protein n=1 Tax=Nocardia pseudobrasiliensis TaxID=45979 RepID=A0A370IBK1_9NOCA|nr:hypothetical protein [Nocardia pseudobrasiliensis]RDI67990.1 hypothetical protein DFR76_102391 [Nocardia pseudobrasiliensis]